METCVIVQRFSEAHMRVLLISMFQKHHKFFEVYKCKRSPIFKVDESIFVGNFDVTFSRKACWPLFCCNSCPQEDSSLYAHRLASLFQPLTRVRTLRANTCVCRRRCVALTVRGTGVSATVAIRCTARAAMRHARVRQHSYITMASKTPYKINKTLVTRVW